MKTVSVTEAARLTEKQPNCISKAIKRGELRIVGEDEHDRRVKLVSYDELKVWVANRPFKRDRRELP